jgi:hypothetical protein
MVLHILLTLVVLRAITQLLLWEVGFLDLPLEHPSLSRREVVVVLTTDFPREVVSLEVLQASPQTVPSLNPALLVI